MNEMEYHEIGEIFEYDGVMLEVKEQNAGDGGCCTGCYLANGKCGFPPYCSAGFREDRKYVIYKLVEQCKTDYTWGNTNPKVKLLGGHVWTVREEERKEEMMGTLDYSFVEQQKNDFVEKDVAIRLFKFLKGVYEGSQVQEYICGSWVDVKLEYDVLGAFDNFRIKPEDDKHKETKDMEHKTEINEVNKAMTELIKEEAEKYKTPPAGIKTIPKRRIYYKEILDKLYETYKAKDQDYGSAFSEIFDELGIDYAYGKLREKINRIKVLRNQPNMVENEGLEDALLDTAGYAILTLVELKKRKL